MRLEPLIARRISAHTAIPMAGIAVGMVVMLLSIAVVRGFKQEVAGKVVGFVGDVRIISLTQDYDHVVYPVLVDDSLLATIRTLPTLEHMQPFAVKAGMLKTDDDFLAIQLMGIGDDYDTTFLHRYLVDGSLQPLLPGREASSEGEGGGGSRILLSQRIASTLRLNVGDRVFAYFLGDERLRARRMEIVGIYETHLAEYDKVMCFTDLHTIQRLQHWDSLQFSGIDIRLTPGADRFAAADQLGIALLTLPDSIGAKRGAFSAEQLVPHTFAWLDVLDANVVMILILMVLIAAFTIVSGLLVVMLERVQLIGLLAALGAGGAQLRGIFRRFGLHLVLRAMLLGDAVALVLCFVQMRWHPLSLDAETYYLDAVPVSWSWPLFLLVNAGVLLISALVVYLTAHLMHMKSPATTLRWE